MTDRCDASGDGASDGPLRTAAVAVVGGGPAGAATAARLAAAGLEVALFERRAAPRWRASGVYTSPMSRLALLELGLAATNVNELLRPISELRVETTRGAACRLLHEAAGPAAGVDRVRLEEVLLDHARARGALVHEGAVVRSVAAGPGASGFEMAVSTSSGTERWRTRWLVGADGPRSLVGRSLGLSGRPPGRGGGRLRLRRAGLSQHRVDPAAAPEGVAMPARLVFGLGWYCGLTPVPRGRVNVGIVVTPDLLGPDPVAVVDRVVDSLPSVADDGWRQAPRTDQLAVAYPLAHRPRRVAGHRAVLVGDAAGFIDPVTGEGLYRAFRSADMAADALLSAERGRDGALDAYDRRLRSDYARKDAISYLFQLFMRYPAVLDYAVARLDRRASPRAIFAQVMSDLLPPDRALDPRFVAQLLAP
jgi:flavin-dependent dehydrogenase